VTESHRTGRKDLPDHKGKIKIQNAAAAHHRDGKTNEKFNADMPAPSINRQILCHSMGVDFHFRTDHPGVPAVKVISNMFRGRPHAKVFGHEENHSALEKMVLSR
jgi:hypothetical protein